MKTCPACAPRPANNDHILEIAPLSISTFYLYRDQRFRGYCLLIFDARHATGLEELTADEYSAFMADLRRATQALRAAVRPDHMNYECLGNRNPHLAWSDAPAGTHDVVIRFLPPFIISDREIDRAVRILGRIFKRFGQ